MFVAMTHSPGCLPDTAEALPSFDTAEAAWTYLADNLTEDEAWTPASEDDPHGPHRRSDLALELEDNARTSEQISVTGTVYSDDYCYTVEYDADGTSGQDRESYTDDQDRDDYTV